MSVRRVGFAACTALALLACSAPDSSEATKRSPGASNGIEAPAAPPSLYGDWQIIEVNGAPARAQASGPEVQPSVSFTTHGYSGSSGCNSFGGNGLLLRNRWFAEPPMATQQGCSDLMQQESMLFTVLSGGPTITFQGADAALLSSRHGTLRLRRKGAAPARNAAKARPLLAGSRWELWTLDGAGTRLPDARTSARVTFEADQWTLETPCATHRGFWRQLDGAMLLEPGTSTDRTCSPALRQPSAALAQALQGRMEYVVGPNGELVAAGSTHWLTGNWDVTFTRGEADMLVGEWRIVSADGATPPQSERPATLYFGPRAYAVWDGCRHSEGVAIATERQLFTHGSGVVTLANCPRDEVREKINAVVAASPRIARVEGNGIALISRAGTLQLRRVSAKAFGTSVEAGLRPGASFDLLIGNGGPARLRLGARDTFAVSLPCGTFEGRWRNARGSGPDYARFSPERSPAGCGEGPAAMQLYNFFTGNIIAAVGPNRDIALFVNNGKSIAARVADAVR